jgi:nucleoside-triphosphatase THEP1
LRDFAFFIPKPYFPKMKKSIILTGEIDSGKSSLVDRLSQLLHKTGRARGVFSPKCFLKERFLGYDLMDFQRVRYEPLMRFNAQTGWKKYGKFYYNPFAFDWGNEEIIKGMEAELLVIDELGPLEMEGKGFRAGFDVCLKDYEGTLLLICRKEILEALKELSAPFRRIFTTIMMTETKGCWEQLLDNLG